MLSKEDSDKVKGDPGKSKSVSKEQQHELHAKMEKSNPNVNSHAQVEPQVHAETIETTTAAPVVESYAAKLTEGIKQQCASDKKQFYKSTIY
ncbi:hypothetical protein QVD17_39496 [Tagetes erecta]|uniref:Uncharacterized protein n=1 Tax=Tagetes erecta TaxID=13708 RepID=A0AAD8NFB9_TARER|nr:hypothetical protein QVD17_39496 [Tagetes erecta]